MESFKTHHSYVDIHFKKKKEFFFMVQDVHTCCTRIKFLQISYNAF